MATVFSELRFMDNKPVEKLRAIQQNFVLELPVVEADRRASWAQWPHTVGFATSQGPHYRPPLPTELARLGTPVGHGVFSWCQVIKRLPRWGQ